MTGIRVGPLLRYVDASSATVWVETDAPCEVEVLGTRTPTWSVHGHHYALVVVEGLEPGSVHPYEVRLDGEVAWPPVDGDVAAYPPSTIRTTGPDDGLRLSFGSCRRAAPSEPSDLERFGVDALAALADRMAVQDRALWPDLLFLAGDQVYADEPSDDLRRRLREAHAGDPAVSEDVVEEIGDFEEYTWLYDESWTQPAVRWLLSTVPSCMMLDDHDLRDDWNTSWSWRQEVTAQPWWRRRVTGAFASYWVYQHLGNLSPAEIAADPTYRVVTTTADDAERDRLVDEFAWRSDAEPSSARWSFSRDLGGEGTSVRLLAIDSRCSRHLEPQHRAMVDAGEWEWLRDKATERPVDHLLLGTTLPFLLLHGIHDLEGWDEAVAGGAWGARFARLGERIRQGVDLEHWSAFRTSFAAVVELLERVCAPDDDAAAPASVLLLSGDVHCSYTATARLTRVDHPGTTVQQLVMSPFRNPLDLPIRLANRALEMRPVHGVLHLLAKAAGVADVDVRWDVDHGPWFDNGVMTVVLDGARADLEVDHAVLTRGAPVLRRTLTRRLTA